MLVSEAETKLARGSNRSVTERSPVRHLHFT